MKVFYLVTKICALLLMVQIFHYFPGCRDPHEYEPISDTLVSPPPAPQLLYPRDDTIVCTAGPIELGWSYIEDAEYYELEVSKYASFPSQPPGATMQCRVYTYHYTYNIVRFGYHYWRVRAFSPHWEWYTEWSETWKFYSWYAP